MTETRQSFVRHFGEEEATRVELAAAEHANGINDQNKGSDPFRWAITIVIGYQCAEVHSYRLYHEITSPWSEIKEWIGKHGDLENHDGDCDYITLFAGKYNEFMPSKPDRGDQTERADG